MGDPRNEATAAVCEGPPVDDALLEERALRGIATAVAMGASLESVLATACEAATGLVGGDAGRLLAFAGGERRDALRLVGAWGARPTPVGELHPLTGGRAAVAVARSGRPARIDDYAALPPDDPAHGAVPPGARSGIAAPVTVGGQAWGVLVIHADRPGAFAEGAERRLARFALMLGVAIAAANQRAELERVAVEQSALREIAMLVALGASRRSVFSAAAEQAARVLGADLATVTCFVSEDKGLVVGSWSRIPGGALTPGRRFPLSGEGPTARVAATGRSARLSDFAALAPEVRAIVPSSSYRSGMAYPISLDGRLWGALAIGSTGAEPLGDASELLLGRVADVVGLAISNAEARERLRSMASTDHLTGLPNQRAFDAGLAHEAHRALELGRHLGLVLLDLDHFKLVNDNFGHEAGNRVLVEIADRLRSLVRSGEVVARVGGEEFAWLLPGAAGNEAEAAADRARRVIGGYVFPRVGTVTVSAGVCAIEDAQDPGELYRLADLALYWAKAQGRDRVVRYAPDALELLSADEQRRRLERARALAAVRALAAAVDAKEPATQRHSERVAHLAQALAHECGWREDRIERLGEAGLVHDVGKIAVPEAILLKPGPLESAERVRVREHASIGGEMVAGVLDDEQVGWVRHHHEWWDGSGYPAGLADGAIPDGALLLAIADAWDAMTVARPYGEPRPPAEALAECRSHAGRQFWPDGVRALERVVRRLWPSAAP